MEKLGITCPPGRVPLIAWLEKNEYKVDYCTDLDIHQDTHLDLLGAYHLLLCAGHD